MLGLLHAYTHRVAIGTSCRLRFSDEPTTRGPLPIRKTRAWKRRGRKLRVQEPPPAGVHQRDRGVRAACRRRVRAAAQIGGAGRGGVHTWNISPVFGTLDRSKRSCWLNFFASCEPRVASRAHSVCGLCAG